MPKFLLCFLILFCLPGSAFAQSFAEKLSDAAIERTHHRVRYVGSYVSLAYPGGDVPDDTGVCTDVVIRSYRALGVDLQVLVHEDMKTAFAAYPARWGLHRPDSNIDHRRVPNLRKFFERKGEVLANSTAYADYQPGDIVTWMLAGNRPHVGIVTARKSKFSDHYLISHNVGLGPQLEDVLFSYPLSGHYRFQPESRN
jgi:uncharacterized protein YijF (DUF1287 family)